MFVAVCWKEYCGIPSGPRDFESSKDGNNSLICSFEMQKFVNVGFLGQISSIWMFDFDKKT